jgi:hypothetical protein
MGAAEVPERDVAVLDGDLYVGWGNQVFTSFR